MVVVVAAVVHVVILAMTVVLKHGYLVIISIVFNKYYDFTRKSTHYGLPWGENSLFCSVFVRYSNNNNNLTKMTTENIAPQESTRVFFDSLSSNKKSTCVDDITKRIFVTLRLDVLLLLLFSLSLGAEIMHSSANVQ